MAKLILPLQGVESAVCGKLRKRKEISCEANNKGAEDGIIILMGVRG
jgi:hypothetical protein